MDSQTVRHTHMPSYEAGVIACRIHPDSKGCLLPKTDFDASASLHYLTGGLDKFEPDDFLEGFAWEMLHSETKYKEWDTSIFVAKTKIHGKEILAKIKEEQ